MCVSVTDCSAISTMYLYVNIVRNKQLILLFYFRCRVAFFFSCRCWERRYMMICGHIMNNDFIQTESFRWNSFFIFSGYLCDKSARDSKNRYDHIWRNTQRFMMRSPPVIQNNFLLTSKFILHCLRHCLRQYSI